MCREAVRDTWMRDAASNGVLARFILTEEERNPAVEEVGRGSVELQALAPCAVRHAPFT